MSLYDYKESQEIDQHQYSFAAIIMAAIRKADTENARKLMMMWPDIYYELDKRYQSPGGMLPEDKRVKE